MNKQNNFRNKQLILILIFLSATLLVLSLKLGYPAYQNLHAVEPLAEIFVLFPLYYVSLLITAIAAILCFVFKIRSRGIHIILLLLLASTLWYTRYYLSGFTWEPDSIRNLGVSLHLPEILSGTSVGGGDYLANFPISYFIEYAITGFSGEQSIVYLHLMPLLNIIIFTILCYTFSAKLFNPIAAFLMSFIGMIGMHYIIFIMGAHTIGMLLLLSVLVTIWHRGLAWRILSFCLIIILIMSHPITPILLGIFLGSAFLAFLSRKNLKSQAIILCMLIICMAGWYIWPDISIIKVPEGTTKDISGLTNFPTASVSNIIPQDLDSAEQYAFGTAFVYEDIYTLNKSIYYAYGALVLFFMGLFMIFRYRKYRNIRDFITHLGGFKRKQVFLIISAPIMLILAILLAEWDPILIERSLTCAILGIAGVIASISVALYMFANSKLKILITTLISIIILAFSFSFPIVTYSIDAYSSFPISEKTGFDFAVKNISLKNKVLVTPFVQQLIFFSSDSGIKSRYHSIKMIEYGDVFFTRKSGYYYDAMRINLTFEDNNSTRYQAALLDSDDINMIYYNPTFAIYMKR